ncbi:protein QmcA [Agrobacterium phage OLIVR5]|uniref:Protein QmcA n=1 Tax=Agrobacterium phage OLIVR5 TaxID=2723773 RepID=A0A858MSZ9_9CAUD|nr:lipoprotein [Agrobacterium phage OLIVR5]QIW87894.1 protein QmcA [Agrobacterium phage OLIVR5]QIW88159.1 protein QmcA [Agrobacterium phage OLIVR6]
MKLSRIISVGLLAALVASCARVEAGNVGIKVKLLGDEKGVSNTEVLGPGRYWEGWNEKIYTFPTFTQNKIWEGEKGSEKKAFEFQTNQGMVVSVDMGLSYYVQAESAATVFQKYRRGIDEITDVYLKNMIRDSLVAEGSKITVEDAYGAGKEALLERVQERVRKQVEDIGIKIERIYWIGQFQLPQEVIEKINAKIQAGQMTEQRLQEVEQSRAEAQKLEAEALGLKNAAILKAEGEAEANRLITESISEELIRYKQIDTWDGVLPKVTGGATPMIKID